QQQIFRDPLPEVVTRCTHRTDRLNEALSSTYFAPSGRARADAAAKYELQTGADSILCLTSKNPKGLSQVPSKDPATKRDLVGALHSSRREFHKSAALQTTENLTSRWHVTARLTASAGVAATNQQWRMRDPGYLKPPISGAPDPTPRVKCLRPSLRR